MTFWHVIATYHLRDWPRESEVILKELQKRGPRENPYRHEPKPLTDDPAGLWEVVIDASKREVGSQVLADLIDTDSLGTIVKVLADHEPVLIEVTPADRSRGERP